MRIFALANRHTFGFKFMRFNSHVIEFSMHFKWAKDKRRNRKKAKLGLNEVWSYRCTESKLDRSTNRWTFERIKKKTRNQIHFEKHFIGFKTSYELISAFSSAAKQFTSKCWTDDEIDFRNIDQMNEFAVRRRVSVGYRISISSCSLWNVHIETFSAFPFSISAWLWNVCRQEKKAYSSNLCVQKCLPKRRKAENSVSFVRSLLFPCHFSTCARVANYFYVCFSCVFFHLKFFFSLA